MLPVHWSAWENGYSDNEQETFVRSDGNQFAPELSLSWTHIRVLYKSAQELRLAHASYLVSTPVICCETWWLNIENVVIIDSPLCYSKPVWVSSVEHKRRYFEKFKCFCLYSGSQWSPQLFGYQHSINISSFVILLSSHTAVRFPKASLDNYGRKFRRYQQSSTIQCFPKP